MALSDYAAQASNITGLSFATCYELLDKGWILHISIRELTLELPRNAVIVSRQADMAYSDFGAARELLLNGWAFHFSNVKPIKWVLSF